ncbi:MAG: translesion error-prone DNA polymerase V autoproteolytic subunit [Pseudobdellovibrio sp.]
MGVFKEIYTEHVSCADTEPAEVKHFGDIQCGFPSPATDYIEKGLNLHDFVVKKPAATFFMRAKGDSMIDAGIFPNDLLVIDRSIVAKSGHIIVASLNGEMTLKRLSYHFGNPILIAENKKFNAISILPEHDFQVFGVLTFNLHQHT